MKDRKKKIVSSVSERKHLSISIGLSKERRDKNPVLFSILLSFNWVMHLRMFAFQQKFASDVLDKV